MTPTQIIRDWYAEHRKDIEECGIDGFHATELMTVLAPLFAAGPWRYDVENAPKDGSEILLAWETSRPFIDLMHWDPSIEKWNDDLDNPLEAGRVFAFATINPPETPNHA